MNKSLISMPIKPVVVSLACLLGAATGCDQNTSASSKTASSAANKAEKKQPKAAGSAKPDARLAAKDFGTIEGIVVATGDAPPAQAAAKKGFPSECKYASDMYGELFREGMMRHLADVFVAVTGYQGTPPKRTEPVVLEARGCALPSRTIALQKGQDLSVVAKDGLSYVPELLGSKAPAQLIATPGGQPVPLYPSEAGRYVLVDAMRTFARAEVLVVKYPTFDVTGLNGKFRISNVPAGKVKLNALLPATGVSVQRDLVVKPGQVTRVELELPFDASKPLPPSLETTLEKLAEARAKSAAKGGEKGASRKPAAAAEN